MGVQPRALSGSASCQSLGCSSSDCQLGTEDADCQAVSSGPVMARPGECTAKGWSYAQSTEYSMLMQLSAECRCDRIAASKALSR